MDPITAAMMAVLPALAGDTVKAAVQDAYDGLKAVIRRPRSARPSLYRGGPDVQGAGRRPRSVWQADDIFAP